MENKIPVLPVVRWGISQAPSQQVGLIRLQYLSTPGQTLEQAQESPIYGFSPQQLRALAETLQQTAAQLEAAATAIKKT